MNKREKLFFPYGESNAYSIDSNAVSNIYERIIDQKSKFIFQNRMMYSLTNDFRNIRNIVESTQSGKKRYDFIEHLRDTPIYIYGAGIRGERLPFMYPELKWKGYFDIAKKGKCNDLPIFPLSELSMAKEAYIFISNMYAVEDIKKTLISEGMDYDRIISLWDWDVEASKEQYFESRCVGNLKYAKTFVDVGAYDGRDSIRFLSLGEKNEKEVYLFEPDKANYKKCTSNLLGYENIHMYNWGCEDKSGLMRIEIDKYGSNLLECVSETDDKVNTVRIVTLDEVIGSNRVDFIKMDIEGAELRALKGARTIIESQMPLLAISIYHKRNDIWEIPQLILEYNANYRFALGHYSACLMDTVLYAIPNHRR